MTCLRYEEIKKQIKHLINEAERNRDAVTYKSDAWWLWESKAGLLKDALENLEEAQYQKTPEMN